MFEIWQTNWQQCSQFSRYSNRDANIQFSKCLMILRYKKKCLIYDEMVKRQCTFCLISLMYFAHIKQILIVKWAMIKQNE